MKRFVGLVGALITLVACGGGDGGGDGDGNDGDNDAGVQDDGGSGEPASWTVFVYGAADNNLSHSFLRDVAEMATAKIATDVKVVVLADFDASQAYDQSGAKFPTGAQWLLVEGHGKDPKTIGVEDELNFDDPAVLREAIAAAFTNFPAERHAVILWDHGGSWAGGFGSDSQDGTEAAPTPMLAPAIAQAVGQGLKKAGLSGERALDIFSFDTCLMAGTEVAWEFRSLAKTYIANAEIDYGNGWDYDAFLTHLSSHQTDDANALAVQEVGFWNAHHESAGVNDLLLRSHVALDMAKLVTFGSAYKSFVSSWLSSAELDGLELGRAGYLSLPPYMNQIENPTAAPELRDVGSFLSLMSEVSDATVASAAKTASTALEQAILARSQGDIREAAGQLGVHIELPLASNLAQDRLDAYAVDAKTWSDASSWLTALNAYASLDDGNAPTISASIANDTNPDAGHLPTVTFSATDADVIEAEVELGLVNAQNTDQLFLLGLVGRDFIEPATSYEFAWNGQLLGLPDGAGGTQPIFVRIWEDVGLSGGGAVLATFGVVQTSDGTQALGALLFQGSDAETGLLALLDPPVTLTLAEVARDLPGTTFTPVVPVVSLSTSEQTLNAESPIVIDAATLPLTASPALAGTYVLLTSVTDVYGNSRADFQVANISTPIEQ